MSLGAVASGRHSLFQSTSIVSTAPALPTLPVFSRSVRLSGGFAAFRHLMSTSPCSLSGCGVVSEFICFPFVVRLGFLNVLPTFPSSVLWVLLLPGVRAGVGSMHADQYCIYIAGNAIVACLVVLHFPPIQLNATLTVSLCESLN